MEIVQRIKALISDKGCTVSSFASEIGISQRTLNNYVLLGRFPSYETIHAILHRYTDVSAEWLMRGVGSMYIVDDLPSFRGNETEEEEDLHVALAQCRGKLKDAQEENVRLMGQLEFMEEYNLKVAGKQNAAMKKIEELSGVKNKKDII